ncbi:MAG TPA: hypothetical protein DCW58_04300 [Candidatus Pacebacteria bacterium]|nr:hypothetical protein [Candidatus Paceibacterota bacterium]
MPRRDFLNLLLKVPAVVAINSIYKFLPERTITPEPTPKWEIPSIEERISLLADPDFFIKPQGPSGRIILTGQGDWNQYERLDSKYLEHFDDHNYRSNACTEASIATILKTLYYFKNGEVPDITVADIINYLMDKKYQGKDIIKPDNIGMLDHQFKWALDAMKSFGEDTDLYTFTEPMSEWSFGEDHIIPTSEWDELFEVAKKKVTNTGNLLIAKIYKYGNPPGIFPHMVLVSSFDVNNNPFIIDPWGPYDKQGDVRVRKLTDFVEKSAPGTPGIGVDEYGFLGLAGVIANF